MPTTFGSLGEEFFGAFFEPDDDVRRKRIEAWLSSAAPAVQQAVEDELD